MKKGFTTLFVVIILGSVALAISIFVSTSNFWAIRESADTKDYVRAKVLVDTCAEIALDAMRANVGLTGNAVETIDANDCEYEVLNQGGYNRQINVSGTVGQITRRLEITTDAFNPLNVTSWQEI